jgi:NodT family efflux transporter outer membrane factor (OMF) lipoprotein
MTGALACVTETYTRPETITRDTANEALFRASPPLTADESIARLPWSSLFSDPTLRQHIADAIAQNLDLKIAQARIQIAEANLAQSRAAFLPFVEARAQYGTSKQPNVGPYVAPRLESAQLFASSSWELDVWGKLRSTKRASEAELAASWAFKHVVLTQLIADVANAYYTLLAYDRQLALTEEAVEIRKRDVEAVKALKLSAVVTGADVAQSESNRYAAEVAIPDLKRNIRETENVLSVLLAGQPGAIRRTNLDAQLPLSSLPLGLPAQLLANRPDVVEAEYLLRSAFELTNVARTFFYPALTLTGTIGVANSDLSELFSPSSVFGSLVGGLTQPILNRGVNVQRLRIARARQNEALFYFQQTLLRAGQEVSNALFAFETAVAKADARRGQLEALAKSASFTKELLRYTSNTNYIDVLTSEQSLLTAQFAAVNDRLQQLQAVVGLYRALGGGWQ